MNLYPYVKLTLIRIFTYEFVSRVLHTDLIRM